MKSACSGSASVWNPSPASWCAPAKRRAWMSRWRARRLARGRRRLGIASRGKDYRRAGDDHDASTTEAIDNAVGNNFAGLLKEVKGIDFIQVGMTSIAINARGFNSSFNNRMLMTEDGRISILPENGLPVGTLTATPKVDLAGIEVLVGPGSALYGPDASNGVLALTTKDPREFQGRDTRAHGWQSQLPRHSGSLCEHVRQLRVQGLGRISAREGLGRTTCTTTPAARSCSIRSRRRRRQTSCVRARSRIR